MVALEVHDSRESLLHVGIECHSKELRLVDDNVIDEDLDSSINSQSKNAEVLVLAIASDTSADTNSTYRLA